MNRELLQLSLDALEIGLEYAINKAEDTHDRYKGYYPERHASVDRDVADIKAAIEAIKAELAKPEPTPIAWARIEDGCIVELSAYYTDTHSIPLYAGEPND